MFKDGGVFYLAKTPSKRHLWAMLNIISVVVGVVTLPLMLIALIPLLGWLNYLVIPMAVLGLALGALSDSNAGRNLNIVVLLVGIGRLWLGGFIL